MTILLVDSTPSMTRNTAVTSKIDETTSTKTMPFVKYGTSQAENNCTTWNTALMAPAPFGTCNYQACIDVDPHGLEHLQNHHKFPNKLVFMIKSDCLLLSCWTHVLGCLPESVVVADICKGTQHCMPTLWLGPTTEEWWAKNVATSSTGPDLAPTGTKMVDNKQHHHLNCSV